MTRRYSLWKLTLSIGLLLLLQVTTAPAQELLPAVEDETGDKPAAEAIELTDDDTSAAPSTLPDAIDDGSEGYIGDQPRVATLPVTPKGAVETIKERFPSRAIKISREVIQDSNGNYVNHGIWKQFDEKGNIVAEGTYRYNQRDGIWKRGLNRDSASLLSTTPYNQFQAPYLSQATFRNGKLEGSWTITDAKGRKISQWQFVNGRRDGMSIWYYSNGQKMREASYTNGIIDGKLQQWTAAAKLVTNNTYQDGRKLAKKITKHQQDQKKSEGVYLFAKIVLKTTDDWWNCKPATFTTQGKDVRHGTYSAWYVNGQIQQEGEFENGAPIGKMTWYFSNGQKSLEGIYTDGKQQGAWTWWHKNGQKSVQGEYSAGSPSGNWKWWHATGKLAQRADFSPGGKGIIRKQPKIQAELPKLEPTPLR